ncbi:sensor histidine kinase [soil metagenome]
MTDAAPRPPSLARRLVLLAAAWSLTVLMVAALVLTWQFRRAALDRFDSDLSQQREGLYAAAQVGNSGIVTVPAQIDAAAARTYSGKYWQIDALGADGRLQVLLRSPSLYDFALIGPPAEQLPLRQGKEVFYDIEGPKDQPLRVTAFPARLDEDKAGRLLVFMAAEDRSPVDKDARRFAATAAVALAILVLGLIAAIVIQVRIGLRPLFALSAEVAEVRKGRKDRLVGAYPIELSPLSDELNALVAHNQEVVERQRTHVGNLAHALKTPLSVMLAEAQARPGALAEVVRRQAEAMHQQVDHHLRRARAAARAQGQRERTLLAPVIDELTRTLERIFRDKGVTIDWRCPDDLCFQGERQDLLEIVGNVMENACKWSKAKVRVTATVISPQQLGLSVEDDGTGLPPDRREMVLQRGARLDEKTPGSGLGLSIVDDLARAYGGAITLADAGLGGLRVDIVLPRAES